MAKAKTKSQVINPKKPKPQPNYLKTQISRSKKGEAASPNYLKTQVKRSGF